MSKYLVRASFHYNPKSPYRPRVCYYGVNGFDWAEPLVAFGSHEDARRAINEFNNMQYWLHHCEYARPTLVAVPIRAASAYARERLGVDS